MMSRCMQQPMNAKTEILKNPFWHALDQLVSHYAQGGDTEGLLDIRRVAEAAVDAVLARIKPCRRVGQPCGCDHQCNCLV